MSKQEMNQRYTKILSTKQDLLNNQARAFQEHVMFMQHKIKGQFKSFSLFNLCGGQRNKFNIDLHFEKAFTDLSIEQKIELYEKTINFAISIQKPQQSDLEFNAQDQEQNERKEEKRFKVEIEDGFSWKIQYLTIQGFKIASTGLEFDIRNYLLRKSKKKDKQCYVFEAIHQSKPQIIRFCFLTNADIKKYLPLIKQLIDIGYKDEIKRMYEIQNPKSTTTFKKKNQRRQKMEKPSTQDSVKQLRTQQNNTIGINKPKLTLVPIEDQEQEGVLKSNQFLKNQSRVVEQIIKFPEQQDISLELNQFVAKENQKYQIQQKDKLSEVQIYRKYTNIFSIVFPHFSLNTLQHFQSYKVRTNQQIGCFVFQHQTNPNLFMLQILLSLTPEVTLLALTNPGLYQNWHQQIAQAQIKLRISSENSAIVYQKHKKYSQWYRERDFVFLRHVFKVNQDYYIADKSIQNINFIPFSTITRGNISHQIAKISPSPSGSKLIISCEIDHGGLLNNNYAQELTTRYLLSFQKMEGYFCKKEYQSRLKPYFDQNWKIKILPSGTSESFYQKDRVQNESVCFQANQVSQIQDSDVFFSIKDQKQQSNISIHQIQEQQLPSYNVNPPAPIEGQEKISVDEQGIVILPKQYLKVKHPMNIVNTTLDKVYEKPFQNIILREDWHLTEEGGLVLFNKKILAAQDQVLSFMIKTFKKNLFSKGPLNISLPVTVFNCNSQLSQYALAISCTPRFLQQAAKMTDPVERMKRVMFAGISNSLLFFDIQKPFNPILGQTYQSFIDGCPFYAEQISHHPPISSILFLGRGYKIHATLQATVRIHMNSGDGVNLGWYNVIFDDGQQICFQTPPAEFTGFAVGDRKFNFIGKGYYFDRNNNLFSEMCFEDQAGLFSSNKWKFKDQIQAQILTVKNQFINKFIQDFPDKKHKISTKDILEHHGKLEGRWSSTVKFNDGLSYTPNQDLPALDIPYQFPLNSNTNYRQDLYYRKKEDLSKSQSQKQRLQNIQRADRKLRSKYGPQ